MEAFVERMVDEHKQLAGRIEKLSGVINDPATLEKAGAAQYRLMVQQMAGMAVYVGALESRLIDIGVKIKQVDIG